MNRCTTQRTISKQECMVLVSGMPLVQCSENIQTVSISDSKRLSKKSQKKCYVCLLRKACRRR